MAQEERQTGEIVLYQPDETIRLEVRVENETVWLNRQQIASLFGRDVKTIGKHINNALKEELINIPTVAKFAIVQNEGNRIVNRFVDFYNLDMILSIGYRVKSEQGIRFRQWANSILKQYLLSGYAVNQQISEIRRTMAKQGREIAEIRNKVDFFVQTSLPPQQGIFFDGQVFDAYRFASDLIRKANRRIVLIDNYVDDTVLSLLDKRKEEVSATIYTKSITDQFQLDVKRHNEQYASIEVRCFNKAHDRFLLIDEEVYHIGASIKDLGKKWFAFALMRDIIADDFMKMIK
ncbi:MAG: virulence RhuM family protein [Prevotella sp.]|nr:virulence RhuM family protein [Prevotella sp.]